MSGHKGLMKNGDGPWGRKKIIFTLFVFLYTNTRSMMSNDSHQSVFSKPRQKMFLLVKHHPRPAEKYAVSGFN